MHKKPILGYHKSAFIPTQNSTFIRKFSSCRKVCSIINVGVWFDQTPTFIIEPLYNLMKIITRLYQKAVCIFLQILIFLFVLKVKIVLRAFYLKCPIPWTSRSIHSLADLLLNSIFNDSAKNLIFFHDNLRKNFIIAHQIPT